MSHQAFTFGVILAVALCASTSGAEGLVGGPYAIAPLDVNGGGTRSTGGPYTLTASTAQAGGLGISTAGVYKFSDGFWPPAVNPVRLIAWTPGDQESLWRSQKNTIRLTFDDDIAVPQAGDVLIREMLDGGYYGRDLSSDFTFTVENDEEQSPRILRIREKASVLAHRKWYAVRNVGSWSDLPDFIVQYLVQVGDADNDCQVLNRDIGVINPAIPSFNAADDDRRDIDGDGNILNRDVGLANQNIPSLTVPKPSGH